MRRLIAFACDGATLVGSLDEAPGATGVLIVSGGNEVRAGAHRGMAMLAQALAASGVPVLRFDRRGVGDSGGDNAGWEGSAPDIAAAVAAFRAGQPKVDLIVGFGNCDAASALALFGRACGVDAVVLANPWLRAEADALPPAAAIRERYAERLRSPAAWARLLRGGVDLRKLVAGVRKLARRSPPDDLATRVIAGIADWGEDATVVLAGRDATAIAFAAAAPEVNTVTIDTASHSFVGQQAALEAVIKDAIDRVEPSRE